jgi:membrane protease YdiL (CAAX protease family)
MDHLDYSYAESEEVFLKETELSRLQPILGLVAGLLVVSGLVSLLLHSLWPILAMSLALTLTLRLHSSTKTAGRLVEIVAIAFATIFLLNSLGVTLVTVHKSLIALLMICVSLLAKEDPGKAYLKRNLFLSHLRLCSFIALVFVCIVAVGNLFYQGENLISVKIGPGPFILVGLGWALLSAASEETIYRGFLMSRLEENVGSKRAVFLQALLFTIAHLWAKIPFGFWALLLIFIFGIIMGWLVKKTQGLFAAVTVHFCVDLAMFASFFIRFYRPFGE